MENAFIKRRSLTLSTRLLQKRHSASPQSCGRPGSGHDVSVSSEGQAPGSPSSIATILDDGEGTPPHKRATSLDDSVDFSPGLDLSQSPNYLCSQTFGTQSPEVGWRWNRSSNVTTDSGFHSAEINLENQSDRDRRRQGLNFKGCEDRRIQLDNKQWRAQQMRVRELLKERCNKLHRQLDQVIVSEKSEKPTAKVASPVRTRMRSATKKTQPEPAPPAAPPTKPDPMADFLNDSESDLFLLEASQQLESKMDKQDSPKPTVTAITTPTRHHTAKRLSFLNDSESDLFLLEASQQLESKMEKQDPPKPTVTAITTPTSHHKTKRPSFYMKFLEDESESEDWLTALEEAVQQATNPKKPRSALQRYKSMPTTGNSASGVSTLTNVTAGRGSSTSTSASSASGSALATLDAPRIKRHASSHALSPATSHGKFRQTIEFLERCETIILFPAARGKLFGSRK
ncbi:hypothetical protein KR009_000443 [Drosophila setifemur]|nr:hypothetical protein KR009_000443 [Drosophila setifemur]